jgi:hypothetical protein
MRPCVIAGCIYTALYWVQRPIALHDTKVPVCRKCCQELTATHQWKFIGPMTKEERENG